MRKIISFFIKFDVAVNVVIIAILFFGMSGVLRLNSSFFPLIPTTVIKISVYYPGASPQEVEEGIILKIEENLKGVEGVERTSSVARENTGNIIVETFTGEDINEVLQEVKNAVDKTTSFPIGMEPVVVSKIREIRETMFFSISGEDIELSTLKHIALEIEDDLRAMKGISQVEILGYPEEEVEISVRESSLRAYNLSFKEISDAVIKSNLLLTGGMVKTDDENYLIRAKNKSYKAMDMDHIIIRTSSEGGIVRLKDVADITDIFSETPNASYFNGNLSVNVKVNNTNTEDLVSTADKVKSYIEKFNDTRENVHLDIISDSSITLKQRTQLLLKNGIIGIILVLIFLSFFLSPRLAFWVAFGMLISFFGMFILVGFFGVTINVLSLFGMIIVIGILVDDGIVIAENIHQHRERGKPLVEAAIDGTLEVMPSVLSSVFTTVLAFSVFLFIDGRLGDYFSDVSIVVILTLLFSLLEALVILPAHIAHSKAFDKEISTNKKSISDFFFSYMERFNVLGDKMMRWLRKRLYTPVLKFAFRNKLIVMSIFFGILFITFAAMKGGIIQSTFFPSVASDRIIVRLTMPQGTSERHTDSIIRFLESKAEEIGAEYTKRQTGGKQVIKNIIRINGPGTSLASLYINLLPGEERDFSSIEITDALRDRSGEFIGVESIIFGSGSAFGGRPVSVSLLSNNVEELKMAKNELKSVLEQNPLLKDISDDDPEGIKEIQLSLRDNAYLMGLNLQSVMSQVRSGFFGQEVQRFQRGKDEIKVWIRYRKEERLSLSNLDNMRILTPSGSRVPLGQIASYEIRRGDIGINHLNGVRKIQVSADVNNPKKTSVSDIMAEIREHIIPDIQSRFPTVKPSYEGQNRIVNKVMISVKKIVPTVLFLIYAIIAFTFRSYIQPLLLFILVPFSVIGVAWGHWAHGVQINILSWLGIIALIGIMVNDGLVLISKYNFFRESGLGSNKAMYKASLSRFRAIFLTSVTTVVGLAPLMLEKSRQAQFLIPMAISISYGIILATVLTLIMLPILVLTAHSISQFFKSK